MIDRYVLDGHEPVPEPDLFRWARFMEEGDRQVSYTRQEDTTVSTVFIGLDHSFGRGERQLFETMVFRSGEPSNLERYATWDEAEAGHTRWVQATFSRRYEKAPR